MLIAFVRSSAQHMHAHVGPCLQGKHLLLQACDIVLVAPALSLGHAQLSCQCLAVLDLLAHFSLHPACVQQCISSCMAIVTMSAPRIAAYVAHAGIAKPVAAAWQYSGCRSCHERRGATRSATASSRAGHISLQVVSLHKQDT